MTREEIIQKIASDIYVQQFNVYPSILSHNSTHQEMLNVINSMVAYLTYYQKTNRQVVEEIVTILEKYHKLQFHDKLQDIVNETT